MSNDELTIDRLLELQTWPKSGEWLRSALSLALGEVTKAHEKIESLDEEVRDRDLKTRAVCRDNADLERALEREKQAVADMKALADKIQDMDKDRVDGIKNLARALGYIDRVNEAHNETAHDLRLADRYCERYERGPQVTWPYEKTRGY